MALRETQIAAVLIYSSVSAYIEIGDELVVVGDRVVAVRAPQPDQAVQPEKAVEVRVPDHVIGESTKSESLSTSVWSMVLAVTRLLRESGETMSTYEIGSRLGYKRENVASRAVVAAAVKYMLSHGMLVRHTNTRKPQYCLSRQD